MTWLRARKGWGATLALFALALQLVTSFGHVHGPDGAVFRAAATHLLADGKSTRHDVAALTSRDADRDAGDGLGSVCQICFTLAQTAAGSAATPPPLALYRSYAQAAFVFLERRPIAASDPASFWSRGPPTT